MTVCMPTYTGIPYSCQGTGAPKKVGDDLVLLIFRDPQQGTNCLSTPELRLSASDAVRNTNSHYAEIERLSLPVASENSPSLWAQAAPEPNSMGASRWQLSTT